MRYALLLLASLLIHAPGGSDKGEPILVHVKEVHRTQDEGTEKGTWYHNTAVVESKTVVYSITCDEFFSGNANGFTLVCFHLSAGKDYRAIKFETAMSFWVEGETSEARRAAYSLVSEKEK